jgi:hypothetical protein
MIFDDHKMESIQEVNMTYNTVYEQIQETIDQNKDEDNSFKKESSDHNEVQHQHQETDKSTENRKEKSIEFLVLYLTLRILHVYILILKKAIGLLIPIDFSKKLLNHFASRYDIDVYKMTNEEYLKFVLLFLDKFERDITRNSAIPHEYRSFIDDTTHFYEWSNFDDNEKRRNVYSKYTFDKSFCYLSNIISKIYYVNNDEKENKNMIENTIQYVFEQFDYYTESDEHIKNILGSFYSKIRSSFGF